MNITTFLNSLEDLGNLPYDLNTWNKTIGFRINADPEQIKLVFETGRWNLLPIYISKDAKIGYCLSIVPNLHFTEWPVYKFFDYGNAQFYLGNKNLLIPFQTFSRFSWNEKKLSYHKEMKIFREKLMPKALDTLGGATLYQEVESHFIENEHNVDYNYKVRNKNLLKFIDKNESAKGFSEYSRLVNLLNLDDSLIPEIKVSELGLFAPKITNAIAQRIANKAILNDYRISQSELEKIWTSYQNIHGMDAMDQNIHSPIDPLPETYLSIFFLFSTIIESEKINKILPKNIKDNPLYKSVIALYNEQETYNGKEHLFAASEIDNGQSDPLLVYNTLSTASYWAAKNLPKSIPLIAKRAIEHCESNDWKDAATAISWMFNKIY